MQLSVVSCFQFLWISLWAEELTQGPWRHPGCWESTGIKGEPEPNSLYEEIIVIGDVHGSRAGLRMILSAAGVVDDDSCQWAETATYTLLIQMGDVVDRGKFSTECYACLQMLQRTAPAYSSKVIRLMGNHELLWIGGEYNYRNKVADTPEKINALSKRIVLDILSGDVQGAFDMNYFRNIPMLLTHAGLRVKMKAHIEATMDASSTMTTGKAVSNASVFANYINEKLRSDVAACWRAFEGQAGHIVCRQFLSDHIYTAGPERGGRDIGGTFWTDFSVLVKEAAVTNWGFMQVVGHTLKVGEIRSSDFLSSVCVDAGMIAGGRAYLHLSQKAGRFLSLQWRKNGSGAGGWISTDMNDAYC